MRAARRAGSKKARSVTAITAITATGHGCAEPAHQHSNSQEQCCSGDERGHEPGVRRASESLGLVGRHRHRHGSVGDLPGATCRAEMGVGCDELATPQTRSTDRRLQGDSHGERLPVAIAPQPRSPLGGACRELHEGHRYVRGHPHPLRGRDGRCWSSTTTAAASSLKRGQLPAGVARWFAFPAACRRESLGEDAATSGPASALQQPRHRRAAVGDQVGDHDVGPAGDVGHPADCRRFSPTPLKNV